MLLPSRSRLLQKQSGLVAPAHARLASRSCRLRADRTPRRMDRGTERLAVVLGRLSRASSLLGSPLQLFLLGLAVFALALSCLQALAAAE